MKEWHPFAQCINLHVKGRIDEIDAQRQEITAREVLRRLGEQPAWSLPMRLAWAKRMLRWLLLHPLRLMTRRDDLW